MAAHVYLKACNYLLSSRRAGRVQPTARRDDERVGMECADCAMDGQSAGVAKDVGSFNSEHGVNSRFALHLFREQGQLSLCGRLRTNLGGVHRIGSPASPKLRNWCPIARINQF